MPCPGFDFDGIDINGFLIKRQRRELDRLLKQIKGMKFECQTARSIFSAGSIIVIEPPTL